MSGARELIRIAKAEVGYREGYSNGHWNNWQRYSPAVPGLEWSQNQPWCSTFVSWAAMKSGNADLFPRTASCATGVAWYRQRGRVTEYPVIGGPVYFGSGGGSHVGICIAYTSSTITTVEGNTNSSGSAEGDGVYLKTRPRKSSYVYGYGIPDYPEGVVLADPAWRGRRGVVYFGQEASIEDLPQGAGTTSPPSVAVTIDGKAYGPGAEGDHVAELGRMLVAAGCSAYTEGPGPKWSNADRESMRRYQVKIGDAGADADGIPGPEQLARLKREYGGKRTYTVKAGDSLSAIAATHGTTVAALTKANPAITDPDRIYAGQVLNLP
ncbi:peptidoglycan-binding protein [Streptomyces sp. NPDC090442]|uniref:peptidoglycan-binding protein n=1 Tax=Streptomyces sp. NPDC090442 TaxID=3365962 RepID=UPI0037F232EF